MATLLSLFCPSCKGLYNDTDKRPRFGTCLHNVCNSCIESSDDTKCPVCDKKNAFTIVVYNHGLGSVLVALHSGNAEELLEELILNTQKLSIGSCKSGKNDCSENLRMCVDCAETSKLFKKLPNGNFEIIEQNKLIYLAKAMLYCSDCIADGLPGHLNHVFLRISETKLTETDPGFWPYRVLALTTQRKLAEFTKNPTFTTSKMFKNIVLNFEKEAFLVEELTNPDRLDWLEKFRFPQQNSVDINSIPELAQAKEKLVEKAKKVITRIEKVLERQLWIMREELNQLAMTDLASKYPDPDGFIDGMFNKFCSYMQQTSPALLPTAASMAMDFKIYMNEITALSKKFNSLKITNLTTSEAAYIDQKINKKMTEAVRKFGLPEGTDQTVLFHKALGNILYGANANVNKIKKQISEEKARSEDYFSSRMKELENTINKESEEANLSLRMFLFEVAENSYVVDRLLIKILEAFYEYFEGQLLCLRYFPYYPRTYDDKSKEFGNNVLLEKGLWNNDLAMSMPVFARSLSG